jgi:hypothetical protein
VKYAGELAIPVVRFPVGYWITVQNEIAVNGLDSRVFPLPGVCSGLRQTNAHKTGRTGGQDGERQGRSALVASCQGAPGD